MNINTDEELVTPNLVGESTSEDAPDIWRWPIILGTLSALGLLFALIGDGWYDALSWCLMTVSLVVIVLAVRR